MDSYIGHLFKVKQESTKVVAYISQYIVASTLMFLVISTFSSDLLLLAIHNKLIHV